MEGTYEVDLRGMGELLLSIGTFRRICARKTVSEGLSHTECFREKHQEQLDP